MVSTRGIDSIHVQDRSWIRYRRYRYDIDKVLSISIQAHCDDIVDIVTISTKFCRYRYKHTVTISSISLRYRQISSISVLSHCRWIKSPILVAICLSTLKSGVKLRTSRQKQNDCIILLLDVPCEHFRPRNKNKTAKSCTLRINHYTIIQSWLPFALSLSLTVVWLTCWRSHPILIFTWTYIYIYQIYTVFSVKIQLIQQSQNDIVSISMISTISSAIQLIRQSWNDIVSISN